MSLNFRFHSKFVLSLFFAVGQVVIATPQTFAQGYKVKVLARPSVNSYTFEMNGKSWVSGIDSHGKTILKLPSGKTYDIDSLSGVRLIPVALANDGTVAGEIDSTYDGTEYNCFAYTYNPISRVLRKLELGSRTYSCYGSSAVNSVGWSVFTLVNENSDGGTVSVFFKDQIVQHYEIKGIDPESVFIDDQGRVVGASYNDQPDEGSRLFVIESETGLRKIQLFPNKDRFFSVRGVSSSGAVLLRVGTSTSGSYDLVTGAIKLIKDRKGTSVEAAIDQGQTIGTVGVGNENHVFVQHSEHADLYDLTCSLKNSFPFTIGSLQGINDRGIILARGTPRSGSYVGEALLLLAPTVKRRTNFCVQMTARIVGQCDQYFTNHENVINQNKTFPFGEQPVCSIEVHVATSDGIPLQNRQVVLLGGNYDLREVKASGLTDSSGRVIMRYPINSLETEHWEVRFWKDETYRSRGVDINLKWLDGYDGDV